MVFQIDVLKIKCGFNAKDKKKCKRLENIVLQLHFKLEFICKNFNAMNSSAYRGTISFIPNVINYNRLRMAT